MFTFWKHSAAFIHSWSKSRNVRPRGRLCLQCLLTPMLEQTTTETEGDDLGADLAAKREDHGYPSNSEREAPHASRGRECFCASLGVCEGRRCICGERTSPTYEWLKLLFPLLGSESPYWICCCTYLSVARGEGLEGDPKPALKANGHSQTMEAKAKLWCVPSGPCWGPRGLPAGWTGDPATGSSAYTLVGVTGRGQQGIFGGRVQGGGCLLEELPRRTRRDPAAQSPLVSAAPVLADQTGGGVPASILLLRTQHYSEASMWGWGDHREIASHLPWSLSQGEGSAI